MTDVERNRRETLSFVRLPLVDATISIGVFLDSSQDVVRVVLKAVGLAVPLCGDLDPDYGAGQVEERPRILDAVIRPRESDLLKLLTWAVVLPAINLSIAIPIDLDSNDASTIHVADSIELTVSFRVVSQQF